MKLHWSPRSPFVRKVMVVLHETGLASRVELVRNPVALDKPNAVLMQDNPLSKIPTLVLDDGSVLFDSRVIAEYLDGLHDGPRLLPSGVHERMTALTWQALADGILDVTLLWRYWYNDRNLPAVGSGDPFLESFALKTHSGLDHLETLADTVAATPVNIGHISIGCLLAYLDFRWPVLTWRDNRPKLAAWHAEFEARPSMQATRIVDDTATTSSGEVR